MDSGLGSEPFAHPDAFADRSKLPRALPTGGPQTHVAPLRACHCTLPPRHHHITGHLQGGQREASPGPRWTLAGRSRDVPLRWQNNTARPRAIPATKGRGGVRSDSVQDVAESPPGKPKAPPSPRSFQKRQTITMLAPTRVRHTVYVNLGFTAISSHFDPHHPHRPRRSLRCLPVNGE